MEDPRRFCTQCGNHVEPGDRFCGRCGAAVTARDRATPERLDGNGDDPLAEWERHRMRSLPAVEERTDEAPTESIPVSRPGDTGVLPQLPPAEVTAPPTPVAPGPAPPVERRGFPLGATLALVGAIAVILSAILPWLSSGAGPIADGMEPRDLPFRILFGHDPAAGGPSLGLGLLLIGMAGALIALLTMAAPFLGFLRRLVGLVALAVPVAFAIQVVLALLPQGEVGRTLDSLGFGVYLAAGGGLVQLVAGRSSRR